MRYVSFATERFVIICIDSGVLVCNGSVKRKKHGTSAILLLKNISFLNLKVESLTLFIHDFQTTLKSISVELMNF